MEDNLCEYCDNPATTTCKVYYAELGCLDVSVCDSCASHIDEHEPFEEPPQYE